MTDAPPTRVFFVHLMKTGGTAMMYHARRTIPADAMWGPMTAEEAESVGPLRQLYRYTSVRQIWALGEWQIRETRLFMGHFPWCATELVDSAVVTATLLRHPVDRTISYLRHLQRLFDEFADQPLEAVYEQLWHFNRFIHEHQTKMLSLTLDECLRRSDPQPPPPPGERPLQAWKGKGLLPPGAFVHSVVDTPLGWNVPMDGERSKLALANLDDVEVLGVHERFDTWADRLCRRAGWATRIVTPQNVDASAASAEVSASFRRRIEDDNPLDMELYARADELARAAEST